MSLRAPRVAEPLVPTSSEHCLLCGSNVGSVTRPQMATRWTCEGNWGSEAWDPMRPGVVLTVLVCDACLTTNAARVSFHDSSTGLTRRWNVRSDPPPTCVVGILARPPIEWRLVPMVGCLVARCEPLGLTACAKTAGALSEAINRELVDLFLALEREGRLDAYAAERGWTVVRHASGEPIELDVPWRLVREP